MNLKMVVGCLFGALMLAGCGKAFQAKELAEESEENSSEQATEIERALGPEEDESLGQSMLPSEVARSFPTAPEAGFGEDESVEALDEAAHSLQRVEVSILGTQADGDYPDVQAFPNPKGFLQEEGTLLLEEVITDPSAHLAFSEKQETQNIVSAFYEHHRQDSLNEKEVDTQRFPLRFDDQSRLWFLPIRALIQEGDAREMQWITLDLVQANGARNRFRLGLRMLGPLPNVQPISVALKRFGPSRAVGYLQEGLLVAQESIQNSEGTSIEVEMSVRGKASGAVLLAADSFVEQMKSPPKEIVENHRWSWDPVVWLEIRTSQGVQVVRDWSQPVVFQIPAREKATVLWWAKSEKTISLPEPTWHEFGYYARERRKRTDVPVVKIINQPDFVFYEEVEVHKRTKREKTWRWSSLKVLGTFERKARIRDAVRSRALQWKDLELDLSW